MATAMAKAKADHGQALAKAKAIAKGHMAISMAMPTDMATAMSATTRPPEGDPHGRPCGGMLSIPPQGAYPENGHPAMLKHCRRARKTFCTKMAFSSPGNPGGFS